MTEIEFKFEIPQERFAALQKEFVRAKVTRTHLQAHYFDTADGTLGKSGVALRLRKEGRRWVQTAKALGDGPLHRLEHNVDLALQRGVPPVADVVRHHGTPVGDLLVKLLGDEPLIETFSTDIWRSTRRARQGGSTVELALDTGRVIAPAAAGQPQRVASLCELELELVQGSVPDLVALAHRWSQRHVLWFSTISKAERGERLREVQHLAAQGSAPQARAVKATPPRFAGTSESKSGGLMVHAAELQRAVVAACLAQILPNATEIAEGSDSPELIHQLRVGIRRLRSALRELDALVPGNFDVAEWEPPLVEAFRALGVQRDKDVLADKLQPLLQAAGAPLAQLPPAEPEHQASSPAALVRSIGFQQAMVSLIGFAAPPEVAAEPVDKAEAAAARQFVARRLNKLHRQLRKAAKRFDELPADMQHQTRRRLKRLRYLAEFTAPLFDQDKVERYIQQLQPAQDALGDYNDEGVAAGAFRNAAAHDARAWFAVGWLGARQPVLARDCAKALLAIGKSRRFWK